MTTKILALIDALGNLVRFVLLPGNRYDTIGVASLIHGITIGALLGDKAYDANWIVEELNLRGAKVVISQHPGRARKLKIDAEMDARNNHVFPGAQGAIGHLQVGLRA